MMGIGMWEMAVIAGIALVVIGPDKFPDFAKIVVRTIRDIRGYVDDVKHEMAEELKPIKKEMNQISRYDAEKYIDALTSSDKDASGPPDHDPAKSESSLEDPYAFNADYGYEYADYNPEVPGGAPVTEETSDEPQSTDGAPDASASNAEPESTDQAAGDDDEFNIPPPERID